MRKDTGEPVNTRQTREPEECACQEAKYRLCFKEKEIICASACQEKKMKPENVPLESPSLTYTQLEHNYLLPWVCFVPVKSGSTWGL